MKGTDRGEGAAWAGGSEEPSGGFEEIVGPGAR